MNGYDMTILVLATILIGVVLGLWWWAMKRSAEVAKARREALRRAAKREWDLSRAPKVVEGHVRRELSPMGTSQIPGRPGRNPTEGSAVYDPLNPLNPISPISPFNQGSDSSPCRGGSTGSSSDSGSCSGSSSD